jgi:DNA-binding response OmpR family regulator
MVQESYYAKVLLVEDDFDLAENLVDFLGKRGFLVHHAMNGGLGLAALTEDAYDAILLDVRLPGMNGLSLCQHLRKEIGTDLPVLMITAADSLEDRLAGFNAGTDDYVVKPFALPEIEARLRSLLRRAGRQVPGASETVQVGGLSLHPGQMLAKRNGKPLELTNMGFRILLVLAQNAPNIVSRSKLESAIWGDEPPGSDALRSHIFALRQALDRPFDRPMLRTIRGVGFQLLRD